MLVLISPTKQMDFNKQNSSNFTPPQQENDRPNFEEEAIEINRILSSFKVDQLETLMKINGKLADETKGLIDRFGNEKTARGRAILSYSGTVFREMNPHKLDEQAMNHCQKHLRILSGLYGFLKPFDLIYGYRLEMQSPLEIEEGNRLKSFWKEKLTSYLQKELVDEATPVLNLASKEYSSVIDWKKIKNPLINVQFKDDREGKLKTIGMYSKQARGKYLREIMVKQIANPDRIKDLNIDGYTYREDLGNDCNWFFVR